MGAVKYAPHGEIFGNVLEVMLDPCSHEQEIPWLECVSLAVVNEHASTANDEVDLVLAMRRLLARAQRERKGYVKRATLQDRNRSFSQVTKPMKMFVVDGALEFHLGTS